MSSPDLFVVCKSCGAEVSPYITECPYCGNRLRKRAPKLDKPGKPAKPPKPPRRPRFEREPRAGRSTRPWGIIALTVVSIVATVVATLSTRAFTEMVVGPGFSALDEPWRAVTTLFVYGSDAYQVLVLASAFLFGWLLERRHGAWAPIVVFLLAGAAGVYVAALYDESALQLGALPSALGLLAAWSVAPLLARRRGEPDEDHDMLGLLVFAVVLFALPLGIVEAHWLAAVVGAAVGIVLGLPLARPAR